VLPRPRTKSIYGSVNNPGIVLSKLNAVSLESNSSEMSFINTSKLLSKGYKAPGGHGHRHGGMTSATAHANMMKMAGTSSAIGALASSLGNRTTTAVLNAMLNASKSSAGNYLQTDRYMRYLACSYIITIGNSDLGYSPAEALLYQSMSNPKTSLSGPLSGQSLPRPSQSLSMSQSKQTSLGRKLKPATGLPHVPSRVIGPGAPLPSLVRTHSAGSTSSAGSLSQSVGTGLSSVLQSRPVSTYQGPVTIVSKVAKGGVYASSSVAPVNRVVGRASLPTGALSELSTSLRYVPKKPIAQSLDVNKGTEAGEASTVIRATGASFSAAYEKIVGDTDHAKKPKPLISRNT